MKHRLDEIECSSLKVVNSDEQVVASVGSDEQGNGKVVVFDRRGKRRVEVSGSGNIILFDELGRYKVCVWKDQQDEGAASVSGSGNLSGQTAAMNVPSVRDLGSSNQPKSVGNPQSLGATFGNRSGGRKRENSGSSAVGLIRIKGNRDTVTHTRPVAIIFGGRRCAAPNQSWRSLLEALYELLDVHNFTRDSQLGAEAIRRVIVKLITHHAGIDKDEIVFEVYRDRT